MTKFSTIFGLILISGTITCQAFCWQAQPWTSRVQSPLPTGNVQAKTDISQTLETQRRDVSLAFFNRDTTKKTKSIEEDVIIVDTFSPDVEHSRPSVDQDVKWMEQEAATEVLSVVAVFALLALVEVISQSMQS